MHDQTHSTLQHLVCQRSAKNIVTLVKQLLRFIGHSLNPLVPEFCFPLIFEIQPKSGSYRLPTHKRDAHRKFFL